MQKFYQWGTVLRPQGINGLVKLDTICQDAAFIRNIHTVYTLNQETYTAHENSKATVKNQTVYLQLQDINDRNAAELMRNAAVYLCRETNPLPEHVDLIEDILGSDIVFLETNTSYGKLLSVEHYPRHDVYCISCEGKTVLVPALLSIFPSVNTQDRIIHAHRQAFFENMLILDEED